MIEIKNLTKKFGNRKVLDDLNCTIENGCIYGLVGANGSGKSTLLRIINDIFTADSGTVTIDGKIICNNENLKQKIVFVPDDLFFYSNYTLLDTAKYYADLYPKFDMKYFNKLVKTLKLDINQKIMNLSKGMKRQCALICALSTRAEYILFDETFDGVDPVIRNIMKKIIAKQMEEKNTTIIMTSHNLRELEDICDNLGLLYNGGILFQSDIDTLKTEMFKIQISLEGEFDKNTFKDLDILHFKKSGSVATIIVRGKQEKIQPQLIKLKPIILDFLPLTLEEIFIYEMEVLGYEFNKMV